MQFSSAKSPASRALEQQIPPILRPVLRAYVLGYASSTTPRLLSLLLLHFGQRKKNIEGNQNNSFLRSVTRVLRGGLELQRFPTFCASLVGGSTLMEILLNRLFARVAIGLPKTVRLRFLRSASTFIAAWFSLRLLQSKDSDSFIENVYYDTPHGRVLRPKRFAGRTMDLTLFTVTRALDVLTGELWSRRRAHRTASGKWNRIDALVSTLADPSVFAASAALIMWAWIYMPDRLPQSYNKWIKSAAAVDQRLLIALRRTRYGEIKYGQETGQAHLLQGMCRDYGWPLEYGDPAQSIPFPCEMVHMGTGPNCEYHAASRLVRSFMWALSTYLPINLLLTLRNPSAATVKYAIKSSVRSSTFLAAFIALYYYGICLHRTRLGPKILGTETHIRQQIDSGICVAGGCVLCGWSVLIENEGRRKELGLFVAPRALATLFPRRYLMEHQWRETLAFAMSTAVVFTCLKEKPERVRGVLGKLLNRVLIA